MLYHFIKRFRNLNHHHTQMLAHNNHSTLATIIKELEDASGGYLIALIHSLNNHKTLRYLNQETEEEEEEEDPGTGTRICWS